jgi:hypothetical protein
LVRFQYTLHGRSYFFFNVRLRFAHRHLKNDQTIYRSVTRLNITVVSSETHPPKTSLSGGCFSKKRNRRRVTDYSWGMFETFSQCVKINNKSTNTICHEFWKAVGGRPRQKRTVLWRHVRIRRPFVKTANT